jgi:hypothetical protein
MIVLLHFGRLPGAKPLNAGCGLVVGFQRTLTLSWRVNGQASTNDFSNHR